MSFATIVIAEMVMTAAMLPPGALPTVVIILVMAATLTEMLAKKMMTQASPTIPRPSMSL